MSATAPDLVFDVSVMLDAPMSGIPRVMHAVAGALLAAERPVTFCRYDQDRSGFTEVPAARVRDLVAASPSARTRGFGTPAPVRTGTSRSAIGRVAQRRPATARAILRTGSFARRAVTEAAGLPTAVRSDRRHPGGACLSDTWTPNTVYCSLGLDRGSGDVGHLAEQRRRRGFRTLLTVYDLIPIVAPQYVIPDVDHPLHPAPRWTFAEHFTHLVRAADRLLVISEATRRDLAAFATSLGTPCPPTTLLPLGSAIPRSSGTRPRSLPAGAAAPGRFALTVGTVEIRKNHRLLLDVWEMLLRDRPRDSVPELVVVGKRGWLFEETYARLTQTPAFAGVVHHVEDATDDELAWCYRNAALTCMPSLYEGWGLPVSESLAFGTPCITSDTSSLPEAGQGCTDLLDPFDRTAWQDRIVELVDLPEARAERTARIAAHFTDVTVADTAAAFLAAVRTLREQP